MLRKVCPATALHEWPPLNSSWSYGIVPSKPPLINCESVFAEYTITFQAESLTGHAPFTDCQASLSL